MHVVRVYHSISRNIRYVFYSSFALARNKSWFALILQQKKTTRDSSAIVNVHSDWYHHIGSHIVYFFRSLARCCLLFCFVHFGLTPFVPCFQFCRLFTQFLRCFGSMRSFVFWLLQSARAVKFFSICIFTDVFLFWFREWIISIFMSFQHMFSYIFLIYFVFFCVISFLFTFASLCLHVFFVCTHTFCVWRWLARARNTFFPPSSMYDVISFFLFSFDVWFSFRLFKLGRCKAFAKLSKWRDAIKSNEKRKRASIHLNFINDNGCSCRFNNSE